jgi:hypothetical protein
MVDAAWLTGVRVRRLAVAVNSLAVPRPGIADAELTLHIWRACGGPIEDISILVEVLGGAELAVARNGYISLTTLGRRTNTAAATQGLRPLVLSLLRGGFFHAQARTFLEVATQQPNGTLTCANKMAQRSFPQLYGALVAWGGIVGPTELHVPADVVSELAAVWALLPPSEPGDSSDDAIRKRIGDRGELYSYQLERQRAVDPSQIVWVARDDDTLGYDIESHETAPRRRIEVKASGGDSVRFFLSENEWRKAHEDPTTYEVHFWGRVDIGRELADEYQALRTLGYPIVFPNFPALRAAGVLEAEPVKWRVVAP